jgi:peptidoglycan/LPS O-acetylase OafA/YrhL
LSKTRIEFVPELEATRGIAALLVAGLHAAQAPFTLNGVSHLLISWQPGGAAVVLRALLNGQGAVLFFFVLSGFVLTGSLERADSLGLVSAARFVAARIFRIYPAIVSSVLLFVAWYLLTGRTLYLPRYDLGTVAGNVLLLDVSINGVMWTMQTELLAIPIILLACFLGRLAGVRLMLAFAILLSVFSYWGPWNRLVPLLGPSRTMFLYAFAFGAVAYYSGRSIVQRFGRRLELPAVVAWLVIFLGASQIGSIYRYSSLIESIASAGLISLIAYGRSPIISRPLRRSGVRLLGRISYSFYLLHPLSLTLIWQMPNALGRAVGAGVPTTILIVVLWIATTLAIVPLAICSRRYAEVPGIRFGRYLMSRMSTAAGGEGEPAFAPAMMSRGSVEPNAGSYSPDLPRRPAT